MVVCAFKIRLRDLITMKSVNIVHTFHDSDWVLHLGSKDIWSKYCGKVLDAHLVLTAVRLDLIKESKARYRVKY